MSFFNEEEFEYLSQKILGSKISKSAWRSPDLSKRKMRKQEETTMDGMEFISTAINLVKEDYDQRVPVMNGDGIRHEEIYVVWVTKVLENNKGLFATTRNDGLYYEITHNGTTGECYVDRYEKESNYAVKVGKSVRERYNEHIAASMGLTKPVDDHLSSGIAVPPGHIDSRQLARDVAKEMKLMNSGMAKTIGFNS